MLLVFGFDAFAGTVSRCLESVRPIFGLYALRISQGVGRDDATSCIAYGPIKACKSLQVFRASILPVIFRTFWYSSTQIRQYQFSLVHEPNQRDDLAPSQPPSRVISIFVPLFHQSLVTFCLTLDGLVMARQRLAVLFSAMSFGATFLGSKAPRTGQMRHR